MSSRPAALHTAVGTALAAAVFWFVTFAVNWGVFWFKISASALILALLAVRLRPEILRELRFDLRAILFGLVSAAALYGLFWLGKAVSTILFPFAEHQIGAVYGMGKGTSPWLIMVLLFGVTGPSEEIYWRGYLQSRLMDRFGPGPGWLLASAVYAGVHISSFNFMLVGAAAVAGAFWGAMYWRLGRLSPVIVSHSLWSTIIFALLPVP